MKALTLTQPWATLVALGAKRIETRSWKTAYRGRLAIHAGKGWTKADAKLAFTEPFKTILHDAGYPLYSTLPRGKVVAICQLVGIIETTQLRRDPVWEFVADVGRELRRYRYVLDELEECFGNYSMGRYAWLLADIESIDAPIPFKGSLGLWECNAQIGVTKKVTLSQ